MTRPNTTQPKMTKTKRTRSFVRTDIRTVLTIAFLACSLSLLAGPLAAQNDRHLSDFRIGDDYARNALRGLIFAYQGGVNAAYLNGLLVEADVAASTPPEEVSLRELNRILGLWARSPIADHQACYLALKANLKARIGATPEPCR
jgi:hypothetical protein